MLQFIAEIMHPVRYRKVMLNSYAERILFFIFFSFFFFFFFFFFFPETFTTCPIPPLSCHTGRFCILGLCTLVSICLLLNMAFLKGKLLNGQ